MNVLMLTVNTLGGGTFIRSFQLASHLVQQGHSVSILVTSRKNKRRISTHASQGVEIIETPDLFSGPLRSGWDPWNVLQRIRFLRGKTFDIVHAFETRPASIYPALYLKRRSIPLVLDWCDWFGKGGSVEERPSWLVRQLLRPVETHYENSFRKQAAWTTVICAALQDRAISLGAKSDTVSIIPNGFNAPGIQPGEMAEARKLTELPQSDFLIGYTGQIFPNDARLMVEAFHKVLDLLPSARLVYIGDGRKIAHVVNGHPRITITGYIPFENRSLYNQYLVSCDILWLPLLNSNANRGRLPLKLGDYAAAAKPILATAVGDLPVYLGGIDSDCICPDRADALADRIFQLSRRPDTLARMARQSALLAHDPSRSWAAYSEKVGLIYQEVIQRRAANSHQ